MEQLSPLDATFLNMETGSTPMHVGSLAIYDMSTVESGVLGFKEIIRYVERRLHSVPSLCYRLVEVPMGLDYPYWIADPDFDIEFHLRHIALPQPGDWRQLCIQVARIHSRPLDMGRAPWEVYVIEGLNNIAGVPKGSFAVVCKIHHALVDGVFGTHLLAALHDLGPHQKPDVSDQPWVTDRIPTGVELLSRAACNSVRNIAKKSQTLTRHILPGALNMAKSTAAGWLAGHRTEQKPRQALFQAPQTRFNSRVSSHRVFEAVNFDLARLKKIKNTLADVTLNDLVVAVVAGGLRHYLQSKNELPESPLTAMVPINIRTPEKEDSHGNQISFMFPSLFTDVADPLQRIRAISAATRRGKRAHQSHGGSLFLDTAQLLPTTVTSLLLRTALKYNVTRYMKPLFNTVVTNVPGPAHPLYFAGAKLVQFYGAGISYDTMGLFHIVFSYNGSLSISITCCRSMMPDPGFYADCLRHSLDEIEQAASSEESVQATAPVGEACH